VVMNLHPQMGPHGVRLDWGPWSVGEANEPTPRPNPTNENTGIHRYYQVLLAGKRLIVLHFN